MKVKKDILHYTVNAKAPNYYQLIISILMLNWQTCDTKSAVGCRANDGVGKVRFVH